MFKALKIINSKCKKNIRFVAAGSYQIEFFENEGEEYFAIYRFNYGGEGGSQYCLINLKQASIARVSDDEFQIVEGFSTYRVRRIGKVERDKIYVTRYWGWLPLSRFGGKASAGGVSVLISTFGKYVHDIAA